MSIKCRLDEGFESDVLVISNNVRLDETSNSFVHTLELTYGTSYSRLFEFLCVAVCCNVLQCVAVCCIQNFCVLQCFV